MAAKQCDNCGKLVTQRYASKFVVNRWLCPECKEIEIAPAGTVSTLDTASVTEPVTAQGIVQGKKPSSKKGIGCLVVALVGVVILIVVIVSQKEIKTLKANIQFTGTQFVITNNDWEDWENIEFELNDNFTLTVPLIQANNSYTVGAMQFTDDAGLRFNPFQMKPKKMEITTKKDGHTTGMYTGTW